MRQSEEPGMHLLPFGETSIPVDATGDLIRHRDVATAVDEEAAVRKALAHPIGSARLRDLAKPGETVALIVNDITRLARTDLMLPPVVDELNAAGIPDDRILVVFALGIHRPQTPQEQRRILGADLYRRLQAVDHDAFDERKLIALGQTSFGNTVEINRRVWERDGVILTGDINYHLIAGY